MSALRHLIAPDATVTPIATKPMRWPPFRGNALDMEPADWITLNQILLRERYRYLQDSCVALGLDMPHESDYSEWCEDQLCTEVHDLSYQEGAP